MCIYANKTWRKNFFNYSIEAEHQGSITMVDITITIPGSLSLHFSNVPSQSRTNSRLKGLLNCTLLCNVIICKAHSNTNHSHKYTVSISFLVKTLHPAWVFVHPWEYLINSTRKIFSSLRRYSNSNQLFILTHCMCCLLLYLVKNSAW